MCGKNMNTETLRILPPRNLLVGNIPSFCLSAKMLYISNKPVIVIPPPWTTEKQSYERNILFSLKKDLLLIFFSLEVNVEVHVTVVIRTWNIVTCKKYVYIALCMWCELNYINLLHYIMLCYDIMNPSFVWKKSVCILFDNEEKNATFCNHSAKLSFCKRKLFAIDILKHFFCSWLRERE